MLGFFVGKIVSSYILMCRNISLNLSHIQSAKTKQSIFSTIPLLLKLLCVMIAHV